MKLLKKSHKKINPINVKVKMQDQDEKRRQQLGDKFYKICRDLLIISQIFICAPMGAHKPRSSLRKMDLILYCLHIFWCLGIYTLLAICCYKEYALPNIELSNIQKPLYIIEYLVYLIHLLEIIRLITFRREMFWRGQMFILDFDSTLLEMKIRIRYDGLQRFFRLHFTLIVVHFVCCVIMGYFWSNGQILNFLRGYAVYILPNVIIHISLVQYYALLFIVYQRGEQLYFVLEKLLNTSSSNDGWHFRHQLHLLRGLFAKLEQFTKSVNDHYSISILLVYFGTFTNLSLNIFQLYTFLNAWDTTNPVNTLYTLVWIFMHIGKMVLILYYNQNVQNMKSKATILLSSVKFEHQAVETTLRLFILQLISDTRSNCICGLIALNMNFITSLLVAVSTLFIFLLQYDTTYKALTT